MARIAAPEPVSEGET